ncbi:hypothetical protein [Roseateles sp. P5_E7]
MTLRAPDTASDHRSAYVRQAVDLALKKTVASHGPYQIKITPPMNKRRALLVAGQQTYPNLVVTTAPAAGRGAGLAPVLFPIYMGSNGYRVCFVNAERQAAVRQISDLGALAQLEHVQGKGWPDVGVLRANGQRVTEVVSYSAMFHLVALGRADLFCRSVMEASHEAAAHANVKGLALDDSFLLRYTLPQYLYTHPDNRVAMERVALGLRLAFADGSLLALLHRHVRPSLQGLGLARRRVFTLKSPEDSPEMDDRPFQLDLLQLQPLPRP